MSSTDGIEEVLSLGDVRYVVVRPHRGMKDGWEVINAWNQDQLREFRPKQYEQAVEYAYEQVEFSSFDEVLVASPPEVNDE